MDQVRCKRRPYPAAVDQVRRKRRPYPAAVDQVRRKRRPYLVPQAPAAVVKQP
jgi:hypothetical protein